jgi:hypothetical protein
MATGRQAACRARNLTAVPLPGRLGGVGVPYLFDFGARSPFAAPERVRTCCSISRTATALSYSGHFRRGGMRGTSRDPSIHGCCLCCWPRSLAAVVEPGYTRNQRTVKSPGRPGRPRSHDRIASGGAVFRRTCGIAPSRIGAFDFPSLPGRNGTRVGRFPGMVATRAVGCGGSPRRVRRSPCSGLPGERFRSGSGAAFFQTCRVAGG